MPEICDYEGSRYREEFWTPERRFEHLVEVIALRSLLPPHGEVLIDVGAGFGRLAPLYTNYRQVVLFDYAVSLLQEARAQWGNDPRFLFVAGDVYQLPFASHSCDVVVMVRVLHHLVDVPTALQHLARVLRAQGTLVLEFANKRHLKAILRYLLRRQPWSPFSLEPHPFVPLNYDFHPAWVQRHLRDAGFRVRQTRAVSHFRIPWLKRRVPPHLLARADTLLHRIGGRYPLSPSVFVQAQRNRDLPSSSHPLAFRCPRCGYEPLPVVPEDVRCPRCQACWPYREGIYHFKPGA